MARGDSLADAVGMLREASPCRIFNPASVSGLLVHRDLGMYLHLSDQPAEAAQSYQLVFDGVQPEREPPLTEAERTELLGDAGATYDEFGKTFLEAKLPDLAVQAFDEAAKFRTGRPGIHSFNLALVFRDTRQGRRGARGTGEILRRAVAVEGARRVPAAEGPARRPGPIGRTGAEAGNAARGRCAECVSGVLPGGRVRRAGETSTAGSSCTSRRSTRPPTRAASWV